MKKNNISPDRTALGKRIEAVCLSLGSRAKAAEVAGISVQHLGQLIKGAGGEPSALTLAKLCASSGYSLDWLLFGEGAESLPDEHQVSKMTRFAAQNEEAAEVLLDTSLGGQKMKNFLRLLRRTLTDIYGELSDEEEDIVMDPVIDVIAPNGVPPDGWEEMAGILLENQRAATTLMKKRLSAVKTRRARSARDSTPG